MKAVIYARYSSDRQTEQSIEGQLRDCKAFAKSQNITIIDDYIDRAITGKTDNRPQFQEMIKDSEKGVFDLIIVYKLDRFARNRYDSAIYKARLKKNGVKVLSAKENITDSPEGIIMESLLEGMAEYYSAELSQKIKRGMRETALKCKATGGNVALGYNVSADKKFIIDEQSAHIVKLIFEMYAKGDNLTKINNFLNLNGYKTSRGVAFNKNSLRTVLKNKKYIGVYQCGDIEVENGVPAIISEELFYKVQRKLAENKKAPAKAKAKNEYILTTKLYCGHCEGLMIGESGNSRGKSYTYYKCNNKKRQKNCDKTNAGKDYIEDLVINTTVNVVLQDDVIYHIANKVVELQLKERINDRLIYLENSLKDTNKRIANMLKAIEDGLYNELVNSRLNELKALKIELTNDIDRENISKPKIDKDMVIYWLNQFKGGNTKDVNYRKKIVDTFINKIFLFDDKLIITYNYSNDNNNIAVSDLALDGGGDNAKTETIFFTENIFGIFVLLQIQKK